MKTVADMKRAIRPGVKVTTLAAPYAWMVGTTREVVRVQTAQFTLDTIRPTGERVESWVNFPKASAATFDGDTVTVACFGERPELGSFTYQIEGAQ